MYNYKAKVVRPITVGKTVWFGIGAEVDVSAKKQGDEEVTIHLTKYARITTGAVNLEEIEGTGFVTEK